jgi:hypothetical protein
MSARARVNARAIERAREANMVWSLRMTTDVGSIARASASARASRMDIINERARDARRWEKMWD